MNAQETLNEIAAQVTGCEKCALHFSRKNSVPGEGPADAEIMFIGEGPGFTKMNRVAPSLARLVNSWMNCSKLPG